MDSFETALKNLGGFHDAYVLEFSIDTSALKLKIRIDDIFSNNEGFPDYAGPTPATFVFSSVSELTINVESALDEVRIFDFEVTDERKGSSSAKITFWPAGRMTFSYGNAEWYQT